MNIDNALQTFFVESHELLQAMEDALLELEHSDDTVESVNAIFRAAHTIKGGAGLFGLDGIVAFTHVMESVLDKVRGHELVIDDNMVALLLSCGDHIKLLLDSLDDGQEQADPVVAKESAALIESLSQYLGENESKVDSVTLPQQQEARAEAIGGGFVETDNWHISLRFEQDVLRNGMDPLSFLRYLGTMGNIVGISTLLEAIPPAAEMDHESCYLSFEINFQSDADKATIESAFEFVRDDSTIHILPPRSRIADFLQLIQDLPEEDMRLGEMLVHCGTLTQKELEEALALQSADGCGNASVNGEESRRPIGEIMVEAGMVQAPVVEAALEKQKKIKDTKAQGDRMIRVDSERLDNLINLVGELVIAGASASLLSNRSADVQLQEATSNISRLVEEIRDGALQLRMVQIGETFRRFNRVVRDVSRELGKDIELIISGAETELDKTVVEKIGDPLMHLVRNAMDHGIESAELRQSRGKPVKGTLQLNAYHESGSIVIEVSDDGGGLNRESILKKAIDKGLASPTQSLTDQEVYMLIFEAGFSTA